MNGLWERFDFKTRMHTPHDLPLAPYASYLKRRKWKPEDLLPEVIYRGTDAMVLSLLARGADPNASDENGTTPLRYAANHHRSAMVSLLLRFGADPNRADNDGYTPLMHDGPTVITRRLLCHGADPRARPWASWPDFTALHRAAAMGTCGSVRLLIEWGADVNLHDCDGDTPLHSAASGYTAPRAARIAALLLQNGAHLNARNHLGYTALLQAAASGSPEMVQLLLDFGADLNDRDVQGQDALQIAESGHWRADETAAVLRHVRQTGYSG